VAYPYKKFLEKNGIDARTLFSSIPTQCPGFGFLKHKKGDFPLAEQDANTSIALPIYPELSIEQLTYVVDTIKGFIQKN